MRKVSNSTFRCFISSKDIPNREGKERASYTVFREMRMNFICWFQGFIGLKGFKHSFGISNFEFLYHC